MILSRFPWRPLAAIVVLVAAIALVRFTPMGAKLFGQHALDDVAGTVWVAPVLIALYIITFSLAVPGSALFIAAGLALLPWQATICGVIGGTAGSVGGYLVGGVLAGEARERWRRRRGFQLLEKSLDFLGLLTLRLLPAFPHSVINYGSGIAGARMWTAFLPATVIGMAVKSYLYAVVAYRASRAQSVRELLDVWGLLAALAAVSLVARFVLSRRARRAGAAKSAPAESGA